MGLAIGHNTDQWGVNLGFFYLEADSLALWCNSDTT